MSATYASDLEKRENCLSKDKYLAKVETAELFKDCEHKFDLEEMKALFDFPEEEGEIVAIQDKDDSVEMDIVYESFLSSKPEGPFRLRFDKNKYYTGYWYRDSHYKKL